MKKILRYNTILLLGMLLLAACKKEGPMGPEGPEGPAGNPGPAGNSGGAATGVQVYTSDPERDRFTWTQEPLAQDYWKLGRRRGISGGYDYGFYVEDPDEQIPEAMILVYLKMKKDLNAAVWYNMPYTWGNMAGASEYYSANTAYYIQGSGNNMLSVSVMASVKPLHPTEATRPDYDIQGIRVVIIPAGATEQFRTAVADPLLTFEQLAEKYNLQDKDFKPLSGSK